MTIIDTLRARRSYLTTTEVLEILQVDRRTLLRWTNSGRFPAVRMGNGNKYDPAHVIAYIEARNVGADR